MCRRSGPGGARRRMRNSGWWKESEVDTLVVQERALQANLDSLRSGVALDLKNLPVVECALMGLHLSTPCRLPNAVAVP